jgi:hypothetical protein
VIQNNSYRESLIGLPRWARIEILMRKPSPWWRTHNRSVKRRGPLQLALGYRQDYIRGARGLDLH